MNGTLNIKYTRIQDDGDEGFLPIEANPPPPAPVPMGPHHHQVKFIVKIEFIIYKCVSSPSSPNSSWHIFF